MRRFVQVFGFVLSLGMSLSAIAQDSVPGQIEIFGNPQQPGYKLHTAVSVMVSDGEAVDTATAAVLNSALGENATMLSPSARSAVLANSDISIEFVQGMYNKNDLFEATKTTIERFPTNSVEVITLGVSLYPDFAQTIIDAAVLTGEIDPNDALIAAITAGADPTAVSVATAAGAGELAATAAPLGAGIGAGGTGGGDTTASSN